MNNNPDAKRMLQFIIKILNFTDITLLCWEEKPDQCHRRLISELICTMNNNIDIVVK